MPQLIVPDFVPQIVWLVITFAALYLIMARVALPRIAEVLEERHDRIADDLERAESLKEEAERAIAAFEEALAQARAAAQAIGQAARDELVAEIDKRRSEVEGDLAARAGEAEARIGAARHEALAAVAEIAIDGALAATARLIGVERERTAAAAAVAAETPLG
jgi:F-type H+-transporting ATPase subunit b